MPETLRALLTLALIAGTAGVLLHGANALTRTSIQDNRQQAARAMFSELLGESAASNLDLTKALQGECGEWMLHSATSAGYAGPIEFLILIEGLTLSVRTLRHRETPGIGDFIDTRHSTYLSQSDAAPIEHWLKLDAVTGATVTSKALTRALKQTLARIEIHCGGSKR